MGETPAEAKERKGHGGRKTEVRNGPARRKKDTMTTLAQEGGRRRGKKE